MKRRERREVSKLPIEAPILYPKEVKNIKKVIKIKLLFDANISELFNDIKMTLLI